MSWLTTTRQQEINKLAENALAHYKRYRHKDIEVESKLKRMRSHIEAIYPTVEHKSPEQTEVGKYYEVLCARLIAPKANLHSWEVHGVKNWPEWIPTMGPVHDDIKELNFPHIHVHLDLRFISTQVVSKPLSYFYVLRPLILYFQSLGVYQTTSERVEWAVKRLRCRREPPKFEDKNISNLESHYKKAHLGPQMLCPHKKIPVRCGVLSPKGIFTCPGHGLRWDTKGKLVETPPA
jgi:Rieske [2Fe-2S] domain